MLLPEALIGGYPRGSSFGSVIGSRTAEGRDEFLAYYQSAVDLGDTVGDAGAGAGQAWVNRELPATSTSSSASTPARGDGTREFLEEIASKHGIFLVTGCVERAGGSLYCSVVFVDPAKGMVAKRRKVQPTGLERLVWAAAGPATLRGVSTVIRGVRVNMGAAICWENYMPMLRQSLYAQNINLYLAPTADGREGWASLIRTIGIEGRCFVVSSNMCVKEQTSNGSAVVDGEETANGGIPIASRSRRKSVFDENGNEIVLCCDGQEKKKTKTVDENGNEIVLCCDGEGQKKTKSSTNSQPVSSSVKTTRGGSLIANPLGDIIAGPQWDDDEGMIYADVDFDDCVRGKLDLDVGGHYAR